MRTCSASTLLRSITISTALAAAACSGDSGSPTPPPLSADRTSVSFTAMQTGAVPPSQVLGMTLYVPTSEPVTYLVLGPPPGTPDPGWLACSALPWDGTENRGRVQLTVTSTDLPIATHTTTLRIALAREDMSVIAYDDVAVSYSVSPAIFAGGALAFTYVVGGSTVTEPLSVVGTPGVSFTVSADAPWVTLGTTSGTIPETVSVGIDPSGLTAGWYETSVVVTGAGQAIPLPVTLHVLDP